MLLCVVVTLFGYRNLRITCSCQYMLWFFVLTRIIENDGDICFLRYNNLTLL